MVTASIELARLLIFALLSRCGTGRSSLSSCISGRGLSTGRPSLQRITRSERRCMQSSTLCRIAPAARGQLSHKVMTLLMASPCTDEQTRPPCLWAKPPHWCSMAASEAICERDSAGMARRQPLRQSLRQSGYLSWRQKVTGRQASAWAEMLARRVAAHRSAGSADNMATNHQTYCRALSCATLLAALRHRRFVLLHITLCYLSHGLLHVAELHSSLKA